VPDVTAVFQAVRAQAHCQFGDGCYLAIEKKVFKVEKSPDRWSLMVMQ
jgi:hypothetical protein